MIALFTAMVVLAAIPSVSVLAVSTRSATFGWIHGVLTAAGIVAGDIIFILISIGGLSLLAETLGGFFFLIKYLGGGYLIFLGMGLWRTQTQDAKPEAVMESSWLSSFLAGLLITLGDQKATLFYLGFFPAFLDLSKISYGDTLMIIAITIVAVGGVKLMYALLAHKIRFWMSAKITKRMNRIAGAVMVGVGVFLFIRT